MGIRQNITTILSARKRTTQNAAEQNLTQIKTERKKTSQKDVCSSLNFRLHQSWLSEIAREDPRPRLERLDMHLSSMLIIPYINIESHVSLAILPLVHAELILFLGKIEPSIHMTIVLSVRVRREDRLAIHGQIIEEPTGIAVAQSVTDGQRNARQAVTRRRPSDKQRY